MASVFAGSNPVPSTMKIPYVEINYNEAKRLYDEVDESTSTSDLDFLAGMYFHYYQRIFINGQFVECILNSPNFAEIIAKTISHEAFHHILEEEFDQTTSQLFDNIANKVTGLEHAVTMIGEEQKKIMENMM